MSSLRTNQMPASRLVELGDYVDDDEAKWLVEALGTDRPTFDQLDELVLTGSLPRDRLAVLLGIQRSIRGNALAAGGRVAIGAEGPVHSLSDMLRLRNSIVPKGVPEEMTRVHRAIGERLWGHEHLAKDFVRLAKDHLSRTRPTPAVMALIGEPGHGKEQAIELFARALFGEEVELLEPIDLADVKDQQVGLLFEDGGPLSAKRLRQIAESGGVVVLKNAHDLSGNGALKDRAPAVMRRLTEMLLAKRDSPLHARLPFVFDFDSSLPADRARTLMVEALGTAGAHILTSSAKLEQLDPATMVKYANAAIPEMLAHEEMSKLVVRFDDDALGLLGEVLATPHAPLDWLQHRLQNFVFTHIDTQVTLEREAGGLVEFGINPDLVLRPHRRRELIAALHEETPDLSLGEDLFVVQQIAVRDADPARRADNVQAFAELAEVLAAEGAEFRKASPDVPTPEIEAAMHAIADVEAALAESTRAVARRAQRGERDLLSQAEAQWLAEAIGRADEALEGMVAEHAIDLRDLYRERIGLIAALAGSELDGDDVEIDPAQRSQLVEVARLFAPSLAELIASFEGEPTADDVEVRARDQVTRELGALAAACTHAIERIDHREQLGSSSLLSRGDGDAVLERLAIVRSAVELYDQLRGQASDQADTTLAVLDRIAETVEALR